MTDIYFDPTGITMSGMVDGQTIDPEDVTTPLNELIAAIQDMDTNLDADISDHETRLQELESVGPTDYISFDTLSSDYSTTSTTWTIVDNTNLVLTLTTTGGDILVHFHGTILTPGIDTVNGWRLLLDFDLQHTKPDTSVSYVAGQQGILQAADDSRWTNLPLSFTRLIPNVAAGTHIFKLVWRLNGINPAGPGQLLAASRNGQFWAKEVF